jgi:NADH-quinone oxidoreductase subunit L
MTVPLLVLAGAAAVGGLLSVPLHGLEFLTTWLRPVFEDVPEIAAPSFARGLLLSGLAVAVGLVGIGAAVVLYRRVESPDDDPLVARLGPLGRLFGNAYYFDATVARLVGGPVRRIAQWCADFDTRIIDGAVNGTATMVRRAGEGLRVVQTGFVRTYALWIALGAAALLGFVLLYAGR